MNASASHWRTELALPLPAKLSSETSPELEQMTHDLSDTATTTMEWTNEKHGLYLESMEATFVNQLYDSMDLLGWSRQNDNSKEIGTSKHLHKTNRSSSGQFKVLREGNWKKLNFDKSDFHQSRADESFGFVTSPWIQHFRHSKVEESESPSLNHQQQTKRLREPLNEVVFGSNTEVSDQNFVDQDVAEHKGQITTNPTEENTNYWSSSDQVVPHRDRSRRRGSSAK